MQIKCDKLNYFLCLFNKVLLLLCCIQVFLQRTYKESHQKKLRPKEPNSESSNSYILIQNRTSVTHFSSIRIFFPRMKWTITFLEWGNKLRISIKRLAETNMNLDMLPWGSYPISLCKDAFTIQSMLFFFLICNLMLYCHAVKHLHCIMM